MECRMGVFSEIIDVSDDFAIQFMHDVLDEVMALFPGEYIHIGGDEAHGNHWANSQSIRSLKIVWALRKILNYRFGISIR